MSFKYLLFDLDGTLTDPREGITTSVQYALKFFDIDEPDLTKLESFIGPPLKDSFMNFYGLDDTQAQKAIEKYREWFTPKGIYQNLLYQGIDVMLKALKENGKILAVASSKPTVFVEKVLHHFGIYDYFDVIVGSELNGGRGRKEEVVEEALRQLADMAGQGIDITLKSAIDQKQAVMIGDREFDIQGGKEHRLVTVGITFGFAKEGELEAAGADYVVNTVEELRRLLIQ